MSRVAMQIWPKLPGGEAEHLLMLVARSTPRALLAYALGTRRRLASLLGQAEAHGFTTAIASREPVAFTHQHFMYHAMRMMDDLIDTALGAEFTRRKLFSATGAFHIENSRNSCRQKRSGARE
jgi:hypothetical protein